MQETELCKLSPAPPYPVMFISNLSKVGTRYGWKRERITEGKWRERKGRKGEAKGKKERYVGQRKSKEDQLEKREKKME